MSTAATKRINRELAELHKNPIEGVTIDAESDIFKWTVQLQGPKGSPYAGGTFKLTLKFADSYPFKPPVLNFTTKIYHPNVMNDEDGSMCLGTLRSDQWKPSCKIASVLMMATNLLKEPNLDDAVENTIAEQFKNDFPNFEKNARDWTKQYAK